MKIEIIEGSKEGLATLVEILMLLVPIAIFFTVLFLLGSVIFNEAVRYVNLIW